MKDGGLKNANIFFDNYYTVCGCNIDPFGYHEKDHKALRFG